MQVRIARQAVERWNLSVRDVARVFCQYGVFDYIRDGFGIFHVEGEIEDLAGVLHQSAEEVLSQFLQSKTCEILYDWESRLWWDGPAEIENQYLEEIGTV